MKGERKMTKMLSANLNTGSETIMKIFSLAKRKGITIVNLFVSDIGEDEFNIEIHYKENAGSNFENSMYNIEGVYNIKKSIKF